MLWVYYARNRWYHAASGRFLTEDPIGLAGGENLYAFAGNDPVNGSDPLGLHGCDHTKFKAEDGWQTVNLGGNLYCANTGRDIQALPTVTVTAPWTPAGVPMVPFTPAVSAPPPIAGTGRSSAGFAWTTPADGNSFTQFVDEQQARYEAFGQCVVDAPGAQTAAGVLGATLGVQLKWPSDLRGTSSSWVGSVDRLLRINGFNGFGFLPAPDPTFGPVVRIAPGGRLKHLGLYGTINAALGAAAAGYLTAAVTDCYHRHM